MRMRKEEKAIKWRYIYRIPRKPLAKGIVLVHNNVIPQPSIGANGFRAWTQKRTLGLELCRCKWAGVDLGGLRHYRRRQGYTVTGEKQVVAA